MKYENDIKERTKCYAVLIIKESIRLKSDGVEYSLRDQFLRSGCSIGANVKEGKASSSRKELIRFYEISLRSCGEVEFWMQVIGSGYGFSEKRFEYLLKELSEITKVIAAIIIKLKNGL